MLTKGVVGMSSLLLPGQSFWGGGGGYLVSCHRRSKLNLKCIIENQPTLTVGPQNHALFYGNTVISGQLLVCVFEAEEDK